MLITPMRSWAPTATFVVICAALAACGRTSDLPEDGAGGAPGSGGGTSCGSCVGGSGGLAGPGSGSGGQCDPCDRPDPALEELFHPEELASGLTVRSAQERIRELFGDLKDQVLVAEGSTVLLSARDGMYRFDGADFTHLRAHALEDDLQNVIETLYPHPGGAFVIDHEDSNLAEPGPEVPTETRVIELSWDGAASEVDAGLDRTPQGVATLGSHGYLLADGGIFPLESPGDPVAGSQSSVWRSVHAVHQGRIFRFGHPDGVPMIEGVDPLGLLPRTSFSPPAEFTGVHALISCGDQLLLQGSELWSVNPESGDTRLLDPGGEVVFGGEITGHVPIAVGCNSWAAFWFTTGAEPGSGRLKMLLVGEDTSRIVADGLDTRGIFAAEDTLYWLSPGDGDGALWQAPLTDLRP